MELTVNCRIVMNMSSSKEQDMSPSSTLAGGNTPDSMMCQRTLLSNWMLIRMQQIKLLLQTQFQQNME